MDAESLGRTRWYGPVPVRWGKPLCDQPGNADFNAPGNRSPGNACSKPPTDASSNNNATYSTACPKPNRSAAYSTADCACANLTAEPGNVDAYANQHPQRVLSGDCTGVEPAPGAGAALSGSARAARWYGGRTLRTSLRRRMAGRTRRSATRLDRPHRSGTTAGMLQRFQRSAGRNHSGAADSDDRAQQHRNGCVH